jgi:hypothetical protein
MKKFTLYAVSFLAASVIYLTLRSNTRPEHFSANAIPFRLLNFDVKLQSRARIINWSDEDETGVDHFELQRSSSPDAPFTTVYSVYPQNIPVNTYSYADDAAVGGNIIYYRLAQISKDGYAALSNVIYVKTDINNRITLYPNPATDHISVSFGGLVKRANIKIVNQQGVTVLVIPNFSGNNLMQDITRFSGGMYFVQVVSENGTENSSFVKEGR